MCHNVILIKAVIFLLWGNVWVEWTSRLTQTALNIWVILMVYALLHVEFERLELSMGLCKGYHGEKDRTLHTSAGLVIRVVGHNVSSVKVSRQDEGDVHDPVNDSFGLRSQLQWQKTTLHKSGSKGTFKMSPVTHSRIQYFHILQADRIWQKKITSPNLTHDTDMHFTFTH